MYLAKVITNNFQLAEDFIEYCVLNELSIRCCIFKEGILSSGYYYFYLVLDEDEMKLVNANYNIHKLSKL